jgi:hypothetical protein
LPENPLILLFSRGGSSSGWERTAGAAGPAAQLAVSVFPAVARQIPLVAAAQECFILIIFS